MKAGYTIKGGTAMSSEAFLPVAFVLGYLLGSIPFGLILTKLAGTQDLRSIGSGNIGATNVLRTGHKGLAAATLICDMLKGTLAVVIAGYFGGPGLNATAEIMASAGFTPGALWAGGGRFGRAIRRHGHGRGSPSATPTKPLSG